MGELTARIEGRDDIDGGIVIEVAVRGLEDTLGG